MGSGTDIGILVTVMMIMLMMGAFLPFIEAGLSSTQTTTSESNAVLESAGQDVSTLNIISSIAGMFFWDFGLRYIVLFFPLTIFITVMKLTFYVILFKVLRGS